MSRKRATMDDVAHLAGVSGMTVSRVFNEPQMVSEKTVRKVHQAIDALEYRRNAVARNLASRRTYQIGVIATSFSGYINARILEGIGSYTREAGYQTTISMAERSEQGEPVDSRMLNNQLPDGIIINNSGSVHDTFKILGRIPAGIPVVTTGYAAEQTRVTSITADDIKGARIAVKHLVKLGSGKIAMITGPSTSLQAHFRGRGYRQTLKRNGLLFSPHLVGEGDWSVAGGEYGDGKSAGNGC